MFSAHLRDIQKEAGHVAARASERLDPSLGNGIALQIVGNNGNPARCVPGRANKNRTSWRNNYVHIEPNQVARSRQQQLRFEIGIAEFDADVFALLYPASVRPRRNAASRGRVVAPLAGWKVKKPITGIAGCWARAPSGQATVDPATIDEIASSHLLPPKARDHADCTAITAEIWDRRNRVQGRVALQKSQTVDVAFGSNASVKLSWHVDFTPISDVWLRRSELTLRANSGQRSRYCAQRASDGLTCA